MIVTLPLITYCMLLLVFTNFENGFKSNGWKGRFGADYQNISCCPHFPYKLTKQLIKLTKAISPANLAKIISRLQRSFLLDYLTILNQHFTDCVNYGDHNNFSSTVCLKPASSTYLLVSSL